MLCDAISAVADFMVRVLHSIRATRMHEKFWGLKPGNTMSFSSSVLCSLTSGSINAVKPLQGAAVEAAFAARTAVGGGGEVKLNPSFKTPGLMQSLRDDRRLQDSCSTSNL
jgi:hypothetical protein